MIFRSIGRHDGEFLSEQGGHWRYQEHSHFRFRLRSFQHRIGIVTGVLLVTSLVAIPNHLVGGDTFLQFVGDAEEVLLLVEQVLLGPRFLAELKHRRVFELRFRSYWRNLAISRFVAAIDVVSARPTPALARPRLVLETRQS